MYLARSPTLRNLYQSCHMGVVLDVVNHAYFTDRQMFPKYNVLAIYI